MRENAVSFLATSLLLSDHQIPKSKPCTRLRHVPEARSAPSARCGRCGVAARVDRSATPVAVLPGGGRRPASSLVRSRSPRHSHIPGPSRSPAGRSESVELGCRHVLNGLGLNMIQKRIGQGGSGFSLASSLPSCRCVMERVDQDQGLRRFPVPRRGARCSYSAVLGLLVQST